MKRTDKLALLQRVLDGKITKEELSRHLNPDPVSISAILITENAVTPSPDDLVTASLTFQGSNVEKSKTLPYAQLETLVERIGGSIFILPENRRDRS